MERWKAQLNIQGEHQQEEAEHDEGAPVPENDDESPEAVEYAFLEEGASRKEGDTQGMAPATEEQAQKTEAAQEAHHKEGDGDDVTPMDAEDQQRPESVEPLHHQQVLKGGEAGPQNVMDLEPATEIEADAEMVEAAESGTEGQKGNESMAPHESLAAARHSLHNIEAEEGKHQDVAITVPMPCHQS